jgi:hypothetical protein
MTEPISVQIVGAPIACQEGVKDTWRQVAEWAARQLAAIYGGAVNTTYYDLFDSDCPKIPEDAQLPVVLVDGRVIIAGGKISIPIIRRYLDEMYINALHSNF